MDRTFAVLLTAGVGALLAAQAPINAQLGQHVGRIQAALISFVVGTILLVVIVFAFSGGFPDGTGVGSVSWRWFLGGALGAAYVTTVIYTVRVLGAGGVTAATISAQLAASLVIDQLGLLGLEKQPITWSRALGVALLAAGTYLIVAGRG